MTAIDNTLRNEPAALAALQQVVTLAQLAGILRVFVDLGPKMAGLLDRLNEQMWLHTTWAPKTNRFGAHVLGLLDLDFVTVAVDHHGVVETDLMLGSHNLRTFNLK